MQKNIFQRRHYEAIASLLRNVPNEIHGSPNHCELARYFAESFDKSQDNFNLDRFMEAVLKKES